MPSFFTRSRLSLLSILGMMSISIGSSMISYESGILDGRKECSEALKDAKKVDQNRDSIDKGFTLGSALLFFGLCFFVLDYKLASRRTVERRRGVVRQDQVYHSDQENGLPNASEEQSPVTERSEVPQNLTVSEKLLRKS